MAAEREVVKGGGAGGEATPREGEQLKRAIGPGMLLFFVLGDILGAGIYARVGSVSREVGGAIWLSFLVALVLAALTTLSYMELVMKYPGAAGAALYVNKAFKVPFFTFMVAFAVLASGLSSAGVAARTFGGRYLGQVFGFTPREAVTTMVALGFIVALALINFRGVSESVKVNIALTLVELTGLLIIIVIGIAALAGGQGDLGRPFTFRQDEALPLAVLGGAAVAFYALLGFEDAVNMAEETHDPVRVFPRALLGGLALAGLIYLAVGFIAALIVDVETLGSSSGPLLEVVQRGPLAVPPRFFSIIALIAITNTALINMIMASRVIYGMARQGIIPAVLGKTHSARQTPWVAIIFTTVLAMLLASTGDFNALGDTTTLLLLLVFAIVNGAVLILRRSPVGYQHFVAPSVVPILGALSCAVLAVRLAIQSPSTLVRAGALLAIGLVLWGVNYLLRGRVETRVDAAEAYGD
ncbi:MAG: Uncharacterized amino acid permease, GabP family [uncultured Thermomicrobiales bacterium]|uniref:Uncharacterized amino acid permease, GabP family n=1 Tax=uncultured Thermomicrobiales bacterium TaxID=1645740 RepID=A0A6J4V075_9BACT|nr:MAG: Uncharacterized amino acid permease, GabP family [uncultured Thermomicrobiales bacterium]